MSKKARLKKSKRPRSRAQCLRDAKLTGVTVNADGELVASNLEDPLAGLTPAAERALIFRQNSKGEDHGKSLDWHWLQGLDPEVKVHYDGFTTAHPGSLAAPIQEEPLEALMRNAGLTAAEMAVWRLQAAKTTNKDIAQKLRLDPRDVGGLVTSTNRKLVAYAGALRQANMAEANE